MEIKDHLKAMLHQVINGEDAEATQTLHTYFVEKTKQLHTDIPHEESGSDTEEY
jgi:hypothetical protein